VTREADDGRLGHPVDRGDLDLERRDLGPRGQPPPPAKSGGATSIRDPIGRLVVEL